MDIDQTTELLEYLGGAYPGKFKSEKGTLDVWSEAFADQDFEGVMRRARRYADKHKSPPSIAELKIKRYPVIG